MSLRETRRESGSPVGMTILLCPQSFSEKYRPERTRISYFAMQATTTYAVFLNENRTMLMSSYASRQEI
jgi:hypothetical protein